MEKGDGSLLLELFLLSGLGLFDAIVILVGLVAVAAESVAIEVVVVVIVVEFFVVVAIFEIRFIIVFLVVIGCGGSSLAFSKSNWSLSLFGAFVGIEGPVFIGPLASLVFQIVFFSAFFFLVSKCDFVSLLVLVVQNAEIGEHFENLLGI